MILAFLQEAATQAVHTVTNVPEAPTEVMPYLTTSALIYFAQKWMKQMPWYAKFVEVMPGAAKWAHRLIAGLGSVIAAVGIHISVEGDADHGWKILTTIPALIVLLNVSWDAVKTFTLQQMIYDVSKPKQWTVEPPVQPSLPTTSTPKEKDA